MLFAFHSYRRLRQRTLPGAPTMRCWVNIDVDRGRRRLFTYTLIRLLRSQKYKTEGVLEDILREYWIFPNHAVKNGRSLRPVFMIFDTFPLIIRIMDIAKPPRIFISKQWSIKHRYICYNAFTDMDGVSPQQLDYLKRFDGASSSCVTASITTRNTFSDYGILPWHLTSIKFLVFDIARAVSFSRSWARLIFMTPQWQL